MDVPPGSPVVAALGVVVGAIVAQWTKLRLGRGDQLIRQNEGMQKRITQLETVVAELQQELRQGNTELRIENALLKAENERLQALLGGRRATDTA